MRAKSDFKKIFEEHWQDFKQTNPGYDEEHYNQSVQKMPGCGDAVNEYAEYRCTRGGAYAFDREAYIQFFSLAQKQGLRDLPAPHQFFLEQSPTGIHFIRIQFG